MRKTDITHRPIWHISPQIQTHLIFGLLITSCALSIVLSWSHRTLDGFLISFLMILISTLLLFWKDRMQQIVQVDRELITELLGIVRHQIATPVSSVRWYIEMMLEDDLGELSDKQRNHLQSLMTVVEHLGNVHTILDDTRVGLGEITIKREEMTVWDLIDDILHIIIPKAAAANVQFMQNIPEGDQKVTIDRRLTQLILINLLTNAVKYTPEGKRIIFTVHVNENAIHFIVDDQGRGIPKKEQKCIFDKGYRASNVVDVDGSGLGLFANKIAAEAMGGSLTFKSVEKKGTRFEVIIPLEES